MIGKLQERYDYRRADAERAWNDFQGGTKGGSDRAVDKAEDAADDAKRDLRRALD